MVVKSRPLGSRSIYSAEMLWPAIALLDVDERGFRSDLHGLGDAGERHRDVDFEHLAELQVDLLALRGCVNPCRVAVTS